MLRPLGIVEVRRFGQAGDPRPTVVLAIRSDLDLAEQVTAKARPGLTTGWSNATHAAAMGGFGRDAPNHGKAVPASDPGRLSAAGPTHHLTAQPPEHVAPAELDQVACKVSADTSLTYVKSRSGSMWRGHIASV